MTRSRVAPMLAAWLLASCSMGGPPASVSPSAIHEPFASPPVATTQMPSPSPAAVATPEPTGPHSTLVGLGDSVPGGLKCNDPCRSYVLWFGELASASQGLPVLTRNLATNDGLESDTLLDRVKRNDDYRSAIIEADIITLHVGWNDWQGPCEFQGLVSCLANGMGRVEPNVDAILSELEALRGAKPTAVRVVTYYNGFLGNPQTSSIWRFVARPTDVEAFDRDFGAGLAAFNGMLCRLAALHDAVCVEVGAAFNGEHLDQPAPPGLINSDGIHGLAGGQELIARLLDEAGYTPLQP